MTATTTNAFAGHALTIAELADAPAGQRALPAPAPIGTRVDRPAPVLDRKAKARIVAAFGPGDDRPTFHADGTATVRRSYFYRMGNSAEKLAARVVEILPGSVVVAAEDRFAQWPKTSYFVVRFRPALDGVLCVKPAPKVRTLRTPKAAPAVAPTPAPANDRITLYTTAPAAYDGFSTREIVADAGRDNRGMVIRKVVLEPRDYDWQTGRYASGLHGYATPAEAARFASIWQLAD